MPTSQRESTSLTIEEMAALPKSPRTEAGGWDSLVHKLAYVDALGYRYSYMGQWHAGHPVFEAFEETCVPGWEKKKWMIFREGDKWFWNDGHVGSFRKTHEAPHIPTSDPHLAPIGDAWTTLCPGFWFHRTFARSLCDLQCM